MMYRGNTIPGNSRSTGYLHPFPHQPLPGLSKEQRIQIGVKTFDRLFRETPEVPWQPAAQRKHPQS